MTAILTALPMWQGKAQVAAGGTGDIVKLDFAQAPLGPVPRGFAREGTLDVVDHLGQRMLRATSRATFLVRLPPGSMLPTDFTLDIDLVPKECCQPEDIAIEGTATIDQSEYSANILWRHADFRVVGGGPGFDRPVPEDIAITLPGQLTNIVLTFRGDELSAYTNGRLLYTLPNRKFVRGSVLRVFLGGQNDSDQAVYLARLRVVHGIVPPTTAVAVSTNPGVTAGPRVPGQTGPVTAGQTTAIAPTTQNPALPTNTAAVNSGPVIGTNPATATRAVAFAAPAFRTFTLNGVTAEGVRVAHRRIVLPGYSGTGVSSAVASRTIRLPAVTSSGGLTVAASRRITLAAFTATGTGTVVGGSAVPMPRTINLPGYIGAGTFTVPGIRTITLAAFSASGLSTVVAPRRITLPEVSAAGGLGTPVPRTIKLGGWTSSGTATPP